MDMRELARCTDAIACLQQTLGEGRKASNVDIRLMLCNVQRCQHIIQELMASEQNSSYSKALSGLSGSLSVHAAILKQKIEQLNKTLATGDSHAPLSQRRRVVEQLPSTPAKPGPPTPRPAATTPCQQSSGNLTPAHEPSTAECDDDYEVKLCRSREKMIESTIMKSGAIGFDDVIGLDEAKRSLHDSIIMPLDFPHLFSGGRKPWRRILLYGPPGTGKTRLAQAVSAEVNATFYSVSSADLVSSLIGESEKLVKELFHHARNQVGQSIIFIDEIDSLCRVRNSREDDATRRIKTELLIQMEAAEKYQPHASIFLLCATNCPWDLDKAFLRRFQKRIYIPLPESSCRIQMMKLHCRGNAVDIAESEWERLAEDTKGYSGSDLSTLTNGALFQPIRDLQSATLWRRTKDGNWTPTNAKTKQGVRGKITDFPPEMVCPRDVTLEDFQKAMELHNPTIPDEELERFAIFTASFGQSG